MATGKPLKAFGRARDITASCTWRSSTVPDGWRPLLLELELSRGDSRLDLPAHVLGRAQTQQEQPQRCMCGTQGGSGVARVCMCAMRTAARGHSLED
eukprot:1878346-Prymnesium_polylepis.1